MAVLQFCFLVRATNHQDSQMVSEYMEMPYLDNWYLSGQKKKPIWLKI